MQLPGVPWYQERVLGPISLGSLVYVVLLRSALHNFAQLSDLYLPTNTLAALANLAPHVSGLHAHAAQRLVGLLVLLARKHAKLNKALEAQVVPEEALEAEVQVRPASRVECDFVSRCLCCFGGEVRMQAEVQVRGASRVDCEESPVLLWWGSACGGCVLLLGAHVLPPCCCRC